MEKKLYSLHGGYPRPLSKKVNALNLNADELQGMGYVEALAKPLIGANQILVWRNNSWLTLDNTYDPTEDEIPE